MPSAIDDYIEREEALIMQDHADGLISYHEMQETLRELYALADEV